MLRREKMKKRSVYLILLFAALVMTGCAAIKPSIAPEDMAGMFPEVEQALKMAEEKEAAHYAPKLMEKGMKYYKTAAISSKKGWSPDYIQKKTGAAISHFKMAADKAEKVRAGSKSLEQTLKHAQEKEAEKYDPTYFNKGMKAYTSHQDAIKKGKSVTTIQRYQNSAVKNLEKATHTAVGLAAVFGATMKARTDAMAAQASTYDPATWKLSETKLAQANKFLKRGYPDRGEMSAKAAESKYRLAELNSIKAFYLKKAWDAIAKAESMRVHYHAPKTLIKARSLAAEAESLLEKNRYETQKPDELAQQAEYEAVHGIYLANAVKMHKSKKTTREELLLAAETPVKKIADTLEMPVRFDQGLAIPTDTLASAIDDMQHNVAGLISEEVNAAKAEAARQKEAEIAKLTEQKDADLNAKEAEIAKLKTEMEAEIAKLTKEKEDSLNEKEAEIAKLMQEKASSLSEKEAEITKLMQEKEAGLSAKEAEIAQLMQEKETKIVQLTKQKEAIIKEKDAEIAQLENQKEATIGAKDTEIQEIEEKKKAELAKLQQESEAELVKLKAEKEAALAKLKAEKEAELAKLKAEKEAALAKLKAEKDAEVAKLKAEREAEIDKLTAQQQAKVEKLKAEQEAEITKLNQEIKQSIEEKQAKLEKLEQEKEAKIARLEQQKEEKIEKLEQKKEAEIARLTKLKEESLSQKEIQIENLQKEIGQLEAQVTNLEKEKITKRTWRDAFIKIKKSFSFQEAEVFRTEGGSIRIRLIGLTFKAGKSDIDPEYATLLAKVRDALGTLAGANVFIEGHTDSMGSYDDNMKLSMHRAIAVKKYLVDDLKVPQDQLKVVGYGESKPIASNKSNEGRAKNRRIEVVMIPGG
jgi:flagellar motor protein MotB